MTTHSVNERLEAEGSDLAAMAAEYGLEYVTVVEDESLDPDLLAQLPVEWARDNALLPVRISGVPRLLVSNPNAVGEQEYVSILTGMQLQPLLGSRDLILSCIERGYFRKDNSPSDFIDDLESTPAAAGRSQVDDLLQVANEAPVTQLINLILLDAFKQRASDIHVEPFEDRLRIRYRIDGLLYEQPSPPSKMVQSLVSRLKVMAHMDIAERRLPQDGMARVRIGEQEVDIRVSTIPVPEGERVVLRLLDKSSTLLPMEALGMESGCRKQFGTLLTQSNGIIIVSGPTGSGKTTTLYAALGALDASHRNILTIEDPIEYRLDNIGQIQVKTKIGLTFASGLRHILRQDPDVILVGETRDSETAEIAIRASLTGHLVFTTLHTNDAVSAIVRLIDMGIERYLLSACLRGILAQRLVRKLCTHCRESHIVSDAELDACGEAWSSLAGKSVWHAVGCERCTGGFHGRVGVFELLTITPALRNVIREDHCTLDDLHEATVDSHPATLADDGIAKVLNGVTTIDEILSTTSI
jgi:general secretion pathway protein E